MLPLLSMFLFNSTQRTPLQGESYVKEESLTPSFTLPILIVTNGNAYPTRETPVKSYDIDINDTKLLVFSRRKKGYDISFFK